MDVKGGREVLMGKYELGRVLGRGNFAKVYFARSVVDGAGVAIKVLDKASLDSNGAAPRVIGEVMAMKRLSGHPNVLQIHEVLATKKKIYLVMEHASRGDLLSFLARRGGRLPESTARRYFQQLLSALRFSHSRGVAHRDIKPQNLLLDSRGSLKLADFGLSAVLKSSSSAADTEQLRTACGTPAYTAPEVVKRAGYDGARADAWSCGVILYVLLAGQLPFDDGNLALMYRKIQRREYKFPPWFPPPAKRVVWKLLDPNPETRMTIEAVMELPWFKRSFSEPIVPSPPMIDNDAVPVKATTLNAFDIISMSSGLDLSGLFDGGKKREQRFTTTASVENVMEKVKDIGNDLGYLVERKSKELDCKWAKWTSVLSVEVSVIAPQLLLVELRVEDGGDGEDDRINWEDVKSQLGELVLTWHSNSEGEG